MSVLVVLGVGGVILWQTGMIPAGIIPVGLFGEHPEEARKTETPKTDTPPVADNTPKADSAPAPDNVSENVQTQARAEEKARTETQPVADTPAATDSSPQRTAAPAAAKPSPFEPGSDDYAHRDRENPRSSTESGCLGHVQSARRESGAGR